VNNGYLLRATKAAHPARHPQHQGHDKQREGSYLQQEPTINDASPASESSPPKTAGNGKPAKRQRKERYGMVTASLPSGCGWVRQLAAKFRRSLEAAVVEARGEVAIIDAALIDSAVRWQTSALIVARWLRLHEATMTHSERLLYVRQAGIFGDKRDRCLRELRLSGEAAADDARQRLAKLLYGKRKPATPQNGGPTP
jgi:hypothetical protein